MCNKKCDPKWLWCLGAIGVIIIIVLSIVVHFSAGASNKVEMVGPGEKATFKESSGFIFWKLRNLRESLATGHC